MANMYSRTTPEYIREVPAPETRYYQLYFKYRNHSIITRIESAQRSGQESFDLHRPRNSVKATRTTDEILELLRLSGWTVEAIPASSVDVALYRVSNLSLTEKK